MLLIFFYNYIYKTIVVLNAMTIMYGDKSFFFAARTLWNKLPNDVNQIVQPDCSKSQVGLSIYI